MKKAEWERQTDTQNMQQFFFGCLFSFKDLHNLTSAFKLITLPLPLPLFNLLLFLPPPPLPPFLFLLLSCFWHNEARRRRVSVGPPDRLVHAAWGSHGGGRVAVAAIGVHAIGLAAQTGVAHQATTATACRCPSAGAQHAGGWALAGASPWAWYAAAACSTRWHHGELVGAWTSAVVEVVRRGVGLKVGALVLVAWVGWRQVGVVAGWGHAQATDGRTRWVGVSEGPGVVHMGVWEAGQGGQGGWEGPLREQLGGAWEKKNRDGVSH